MKTEGHTSSESETEVTITDSNSKHGGATTGLGSGFILNGRNQTLERESKGCVSVLLYMTLYVNLDVWKQVTTYGIKYYNGGVYPVPHTFVVTVTELMKLAIFLAVAAREGTLSQVRLSPLYAVPSLIYALNNNMYLYALHYTTPPVWNIVIQVRILVAAMAYRVVFKKLITPVQFLALGVLVMAIVATQLTAGDVSGVSGADLTVPLMLAAVLSVTSTTAGFTMEVSMRHTAANIAKF